MGWREKGGATAGVGVRAGERTVWAPRDVGTQGETSVIFRVRPVSFESEGEHTHTCAMWYEVIVWVVET